MEILREEIKKIPANLADFDALEKAKKIAAAHILEITGSDAFRHYNLNKLKSFEKRWQIIDLYGGLFDEVFENLIFLLVFIYWLHDIGYIKKGIDIDHGRAGVALLHEWGVMDLFDPGLRFVIGYAIENHSILKLPDLSPDVDEIQKTADICASILRDWDKLGGFVNKLDGWLADENIKQKEIDQWNSAGETNLIEPEMIIDDFQKFLPISNNIIKTDKPSYEALTLLYFAWIFDINYRETMAAVVRLGIANKFLRYFERQLTKDPRQYATIKKSFEEFLKSQNF